MSNAADLLLRMRHELRSALPERAFLRRDRGDALFISNAPAFDPGIRSLPGFILIPEGKLLRILPEEKRLLDFEAGISEMPDDLSRSLLRFRGLPVPEENLRLFAWGLKLIDAGEALPAVEKESYDRALRQRTALALRGESGGGLCACALINHELIS